MQRIIASKPGSKSNKKYMGVIDYRNGLTENQWNALRAKRRRRVERIFRNIYFTVVGLVAVAIFGFFSLLILIQLLH